MKGMRLSDLYIGRILVAVGALIILVAGPCTLFFGWGMFSLYGLQPDLLFLNGLFGGLPLLLGILLVFFGRRKVRQSETKSTPRNDGA